MATWKKIVTSGSAADLSSLTLDTGLANSELANSTISFGGVSLALGASDATPAFDLADATGYLTSNLSGTISNAQLAGSIANAKLANSAITIAGSSTSLGGSISQATILAGSNVISGSGDLANVFLSTTGDNVVSSSAQIDGASITNNTMAVGGVTLTLGGTDATPAFDLADATGYLTSNLSGTITNAQLAGSIANAKLSNSSVTVGTTAIALGASSTTLAGMTGIDFTAANATIGASIGANSLTLGAGDSTVVVAGDLTVNGTTTTVATTNTVVEDQLLFLATGSKDANKDAGIVVQDGSTDLQGAALYHDTNDSRWAVASGVAHNATSITALQYITTVKTSTDFPDTTSGSFGVGEMWVDTDTNDGEIYIRVS